MIAKQAAAGIDRIARAEDLDLEAVGALKALRSGDQAMGEQGLERAFRRQVVEQRRLQCCEPGGAVLGQQEMLPGAQPVPVPIWEMAWAAPRQTATS